MPRFTSCTRIQHRQYGHWNSVWATAILWLAAAAFAQPVELPVPEGVLPPEIPEVNPPTQAKVELGRKLYFDTRLSTDGTVACATCHDPRHGFADGRGATTSAGVGGALGTRNAPTVLNAAFLLTQFWDGRAATLEDQAVQPLINPVEHGFADHAAVVARIEELSDYPPLFEAAFGGGEITIERVGQAIASFERTLISLDAPIDRFIAGDAARSRSPRSGAGSSSTGRPAATPATATSGRSRSSRTRTTTTSASACRRSTSKPWRRGRPRPSPPASRSTSSRSQDPQASELGRFIVTREPKHLGAFKTPSSATSRSPRPTCTTAARRRCAT